MRHCLWGTAHVEASACNLEPLPGSFTFWGFIFETTACLLCAQRLSMQALWLPWERGTWDTLGCQCQLHWDARQAPRGIS